MPKSSAAVAKYDFHAITPRSAGEPGGATSVENSKANATDADPAGVANLVNAMFEERIPVIHRLGIRIVEVRDGLIVGAAPLGSNLKWVGEVEFVLNAELTDTAGVVVATTHGTDQVRRL